MSVLQMKHYSGKTGGLIAQMTDQHLLNTIKFLIRKAKPNISVDAGKSQFSEIEMKVYGLQQKDASNVATEINHLADQLFPYVFEAMFRPEIVEEVSEIMQTTFNRYGALPGNPFPELVINALTSGEIEDPEAYRSTINQAVSSVITKLRTGEWPLDDEEDPDIPF